MVAIQFQILFENHKNKQNTTRHFFIYMCNIMFVLFHILIFMNLHLIKKIYHISCICEAFKMIYCKNAYTNI